MFSLSRPDRWGLLITTRAGLGVSDVADANAPTFNFGDHFVIDIFIDFFARGSDVDFLTSIVRHDTEYFELPTTKQKSIDASAKPIDVQSFISHLNHEIAEILPYVSGDKSYDFAGNPEVHLTSMRDAIAFMESNDGIPLYLVARRDR